MTILEIKQEINQFKLKKCDLSHEQVALDRDTLLPIKDIIQGEKMFQRVEICPQKDRNQQLACAHSGALIRFNEMTEEIAQQDQQVHELCTQLNNLMFEVYMLDHRKGDLEKLYAEVRESSYLGPMTYESILEELNTCRQKHRLLIDQIQEVKTSIIQRLDHLITDNG